MVIGCGAGGTGSDLMNPPIMDTAPVSDGVDSTTEPFDVLALWFPQANGANIRMLNTLGNNTVPVFSDGFDIGLVPGLEDQSALRFDGFSTRLTIPVATDSAQGLMLGAWWLLQSYPSDREVPYTSLSPGTLLEYTEPASRIAVQLNTFGQLFVEVEVEDIVHRSPLLNDFPLHEWTHVGLYVQSQGSVGLFLDGKLAISVAVDAPLSTNGSASIGRGINLLRQSPVQLNGINGALARLSVYGVNSEQSQWPSALEEERRQLAHTESALEVPSPRFVNDLHRPRFHPIPPANWANEPHGFVVSENRFHLFYQRTPNVPFKTQMHWGHLMSSDLVTWLTLPDALYPTLTSGTDGFDMKGIWSGDVVVYGDMAYAYYTSVNHGSKDNPAISLATSSDRDLREWHKQGPLFDRSGALDMRDPYVFRDDDGWHMIVGAALPTGGGLLHYTSSDLSTWQPADSFSQVPFEDLDIDSTIWEMPVFVQLTEDVWCLVVNPIGDSVGSYPSPNVTRPVYWVGQWDGDAFTPITERAKPLEPIHGFLAPSVTRDNTGRTVAIGIVDERRTAQAQMAAGWNNVFSLPREWHLLPDGQHIGQRLAAEVEQLRQGAPTTVSMRELDSEHTLVAEGRQLDAEVSFEPGGASRWGVVLGGHPENLEFTRVYYDQTNGELVVDKRRSSLAGGALEQIDHRAVYDATTFGVPETFRVVIDHSLAEIFINDRVALSVRYYPALAASQQFGIYQSGGLSGVTADVWRLRSTTIDPAPGGPTSSAEVGTGVRVPSAAFEQLLASFDDPAMTLANGWTATGVFTSNESWRGTSRRSRIGEAAVSTCEINGVAGYCDPPVGTLTSPLVRVTHPYHWLALLLSGGDGQADVGLRVLDAAGELLFEHKSASCSPSYIDGNDDWLSIDLTPWSGQDIRIELFDEATGACGFVSFDHLHLRTAPL